MFLPTLPPPLWSLGSTIGWARTLEDYVDGCQYCDGSTYFHKHVQPRALTWLRQLELDE